jgi:hypothetical protein
MEIKGMTPEQQTRYNAAAHSYQSAIAFQITRLGLNGAGADPKYLRTGINSAMADHGALALLLVEKGVITEAEYSEAIVKGAEREAELMTQLTREKCGLPDTVTFG